MIRIPTGDLIALITDLAGTVGSKEQGPATASILLHTDRGYGIPTEPGKNDLLVGTSTNRVAIGHTYVTCYGQEAEPMLWPIDDALGVVAYFKPRARDNKDHAVQITREGEHVIVQEDGDLFDDGGQVTFTVADLMQYPRGMWELLTSIPIATKRFRARLDMHTGSWAPFMAVAKRRNSVIETYRYTETGPILIAIGEKYRGAVTPGRWNYDDKNAGLMPAGDVYPADLPDLEDDEPETGVAGLEEDSVPAVEVEPELPLEDQKASTG